MEHPPIRTGASGNMIVPLIPLFLVANVSVNEVGHWKYGPEAIYNVEFDAFARPQNSTQSQIATTNSTLKLKCRPDEQVLNCRFQEDRLVLTLVKSGVSQVMKDNEEFGQDGPGEDVFQLQFQPEGLKDIVVSASISPGKLDIIRALVSPLNLGWDMSDVSTKPFRVLESSAAGELCDTTCELSYSPDSMMHELPGNSFELDNIRDSKYPGLTLKELRKTRNLEKCHFRADYFYGSREASRVPPTPINTTLVSSKSQMTITKKNFVSYTENVVTVDDQMIQGTRTIITERITLSLEDIAPADGPMPKISDPSKASIYPTTWLRDDESSEESQESSQSVD